MRPCFLTSTALHTRLGCDLAGSLAATLDLTRDPDLVDIEFGSERRQVPYYLLADVPLKATESRLYRIVGPVIDCVLQKAALTASQRRRCGLFLGSSSFDIGVTESRYRCALQRNSAALVMEDGNSIGTLAADLRQRFGLGGPCYSFSTACTGSANALLHADAMIRGNLLDHALVLGVETFNAVTVLGFSGLQLLSATAMRPFSANRSGVVLGEGCAAALLAPRPGPEQSWRLVAGANQCDTYGMSTANPDGSTVAAVMLEALARAALDPTDIIAIKAHGTATASGDDAEAAGLLRVFATIPPVCALKPFLGHTLGACGLNELLLFCAAADHGFLIATPGVGTGDGPSGLRLNQTRSPLPAGHYMLNYFGFGGNNTSLIVSNLPVA